MPDAHRENGFRFFFYSSEAQEPPHVHVEYAGAEAKFWIDADVTLARNRRMKRADLKAARLIAEANKEKLINEWKKHFQKQ